MSGIFTGVGSPGTLGLASGGRFFVFNNISTTPQQVLPGNPAIQRITFHNPGANDIMIAPSFHQTNGSDVALTPSPSLLGGCFRVFGSGGTLIVSGECQKAWQAFALTGASNALTIKVDFVAS